MPPDKPIPASSKPAPKSMTPRTRLGRGGESLAANWLEAHGYRIIARNWHCHYGELDLVATDADGSLIGVEVKTRRGTAMGAPEEAITPAKRRRLLTTLQLFVQGWMERQGQGAQTPEPAYRLDVVAIQLTPRGAIDEIRHYPNAITLDE